MKSMAILITSLIATGCVHYPYGHGGGHYGQPAIPKGHMPPPGECRIWYPDRPAGQQPPPGDCRKLHRQVPPGAYLIEG